MNSELSELVVQLITNIGVGNFILVIVVMSLVANLPGIITKIIGLFTSGKKEKDMQQVVGFIKTKLTDCCKNLEDIKKDVTEIKNSSDTNAKNAKDLKFELKSFNQERRKENMMLIENMEDISSSILSIKNILRNVMSEDDAIRLVSYVLGVFKGFAASLMEKVMISVESFSKTDDKQFNEKSLKSEMENCWSDLKIEVSRFNSPVKLKPLLDSYDSEFWAEDGMFANIVNLSTSSDDVKMIKESIKKQIDIGVRSLFNKISDSLEKNKI